MPVSDMVHQANLEVCTFKGTDQWPSVCMGRELRFHRCDNCGRCISQHEGIVVLMADARWVFCDRTCRDVRREVT